MIVRNIDKIAGILAGMKLSKITDKEVKNNLLKTFIEARKIAKDIDAERLEIIAKFQSDWMEELKAVEDFRIKKVPVIGHQEYLEAEKDANALLDSLFEKDVDLKICPVTMDNFMSFCGSEEITFEQVAFLQDNGVIV